RFDATSPFSRVDGGGGHNRAVSMDEVAFQAWLRRVPGFEGAVVQEFVRADGGASNLTYRVALGAAPMPAVAVRVQRERGIFEPYDVVREGRVIRHLGDSDIPVPAFIGAEPDTDVLGAPFVVMEWVDAPHM